MLETFIHIQETRRVPSLYRAMEGYAVGTKSDRPADYRAVPGGDYALWLALPQAPADHARLLSGRPRHSLVGDFALDCRGGDEHADHHQHSRARLRFESDFPASGDGLCGGARHHKLCITAPVFSRRPLHGLPTDRAAFWSGAADGNSGTVSPDQSSGGGRARIRRIDRCVDSARNRRDHFDCNYHFADFDLHL